MLVELIDTAGIVSKNSNSPTVMFTTRLVLPSAMTWTEKSACVANLPHLHKHTRARFLLLAVVMVLLLYCGWLRCSRYQYYCRLGLSSLVTRNGKRKNERKKTTKREKR